jgi:hypothetical protein
LTKSGTLPSTILRASPSAIAVLPTPGSPIRITLDFTRRANTNCISSISFSRPITGSIFLFLALVVRLVQNCRRIFSNWGLFFSARDLSSTTESVFKNAMNASLSILDFLMKKLA